MRIIEEDFVMVPCGYGKFDIAFRKKNDKGEDKLYKPAYGCSLSSCIKKIIYHRLNTKFEGESVYLLEMLQELVKISTEIKNLCKECSQ